MEYRKMTPRNESFTPAETARMLTEAPDSNGIDVEVNKGSLRGRIGPKALAVIIGAFIGTAPWAVSTLTTPATASDDKIKAVAKDATEANTKATEAKATAERAMQKVDVLAERLEAQTKALDKMNDNHVAQAAQLNQLIGVLRGMAKP